jgi:hypothetical protein
MPFAVFRQHQRKLLAVFAILAMVGFVLSDTLPRWMNSGGLNDKDLEVAELYGKKIHRSDLNAMRQKRQYANQFMAYADRFGNMNFFGGMSDAEIIDSFILEHEADRLGIPATAAFAQDWVDQQTNGAMNAGLFETILTRFDNKLGGEQLLIDIASQARLLLARSEIAMPIITPLDVFRNYRDQTERTSFKVVPYLAESFTGQVGEPTESQLLELYDKYKDVLPDPASPMPGFKVPRKVNIEFLWTDINQIVKKARARTTENELKEYYDAHKTEYPLDIELPVNLFAGAPELTPPRYTPFDLVRESIAETIAREKANEELQETFAKIRTDIIDKFADDYHNVEDEITDAKKEGQPIDKYVLPERKDLSGAASLYGLKHETTGLVDQREAGTNFVISLARSGSVSGTSMDPKDVKGFAEVAFSPKTLLFESFEMNDPFGNRYVGRKIADEPAHVADLKEVRDQVVHAWKLEKARLLAKKAADEYAAKLRTLGGQIKELSVDTRPVLSIDSVTKLQPGMPIPSQYPGLIPGRRGPAVPSEIRQIPQPGSALIDALFALKSGDVTVEADLPQSTYYVMAFEQRQPVTFLSLMGPNGALASYWGETQVEVMRRNFKEGMDRLREQAGYKPQNYPATEKSRDEDES